MTAEAAGIAERLTKAQRHALVLLDITKDDRLCNVAVLRACGVQRRVLLALKARRLARYRPRTEGVGPRHWESWGCTPKLGRAVAHILREQEKTK